MTVVIAMDSSALKEYESYLAPGGLLIINTAMVKGATDTPISRQCI